MPAVRKEATKKAVILYRELPKFEKQYLSLALGALDFRLRMPSTARGADAESGLFKSQRNAMED